MDGFLGAGDLYIDRRDSSSNLTGLQLIGAGKLELFAEAELKEQTGKGRSTYGQVITSATLPGKTNIKITLTEVDKEVLAIAFLGSVAAANQASGSVLVGTPEAIVAHHDKHTELAYESVSAVVVKDETDTTTHVEGDDYEVDTRLGLIKVLSTGSIADGATIHISYTYAAVTKDKITAADSPVISCRVLLDGINYANNKDVKVIIDLARLKPSSAVDFLADDFLPLELEGLCEIVDGSSPFEVHYHA